MYKFGARSKAKLLTVRADLRSVAYETLHMSPYDITIVWGWRSEEAQNQAFFSGNSKVQWPDSQHNMVDENGDPLSNALDFAPWCLLPSGKMGIPWDDTHAFAVLGGMFIATGIRLNAPIIYGGDWDMDGITTDQRLMDWGHIEIMHK